MLRLLLLVAEVLSLSCTALMLRVLLALADAEMPRMDTISISSTLLVCMFVAPVFAESALPSLDPLKLELEGSSSTISISGRGVGALGLASTAVATVGVAACVGASVCARSRNGNLTWCEGGMSRLWSCDSASVAAAAERASASMRKASASARIPAVVAIEILRSAFVAAADDWRNGKAGGTRRFGEMGC
mgnify:CR=1 FL=1